MGSDHYPLLMEMTARPDNCIKYFRFLNCWVEQPLFEKTVTTCWVEQPLFEKTVTTCWNRPVEGSPITWSKMQFGDIYAKVKEFEERVKVAKDNLLQNNTEKHREELHSINAEYIRYMKLEEAILKQKSQLQWFQEGDGNSKYFHAFIRGRKKRLFIHKILNDNDEWIQGEETMINELPMECIPRIVNQEHNDSLKETPSIDELKEVVFSMNPNSTAGLDGMNGYFFQKC
ncbi:hypothetical protein H5410_027571 [Solanum commersonii]|uniref:Uncharacterized protein n=1 Tax=Solanum commersonii TaxID=4109 RepID=A0A9J5Z2E4_SOLCO|nr:hypothetical protein H5410_027571 [Solanum commersonii]